MKKIPFDQKPKYGGLINFASNGVKDPGPAFDYGFRLGWQTCWYEINKTSEKRWKNKEKK